MSTTSSSSGSRPRIVRVILRKRSDAVLWSSAILALGVLLLDKRAVSAALAVGIAIGFAQAIPLMLLPVVISQPTFQTKHCAA